MPRVVLVTGAAGFVGSHLLQLLVGQDDVDVVAWRRPRPSGGHVGPSRAFPVTSRLRWMEVDMLDGTTVSAALADSRPTHVYHLAGVAGVHASWNNVVSTLEGNVRGTDRLFGAIRSVGLSPRVLVPGSGLVYRPAARAITENDPLGPLSPYAVSKLAQEMLARQWLEDGLDVVLTRSFTHVGPGQDPSYAASSFAQQIATIEAGRRDAVLHVGFLAARRDLLDVRDTVRAYRALMMLGEPGRLYNVCSGRARSMSDVLDALLRLARVPIRVEQESTRLRPQDNAFLLGDPARIRAEIGWEPVIPFEDTIADLLEFWRASV